jgi:hypothetical protein
MEYSSTVCLLLNIGLIPFSPAVVDISEFVIVLGIIAFARKMAAENHEKTKRLAVVGISGDWNPQRNGSAHILYMVNVERRTVVDFEVIEKVNASGRDDCKGSSSVI